MKMLLDLTTNTAFVERSNGTLFTLSADSRENLMSLVSMWLQPIEHWDGEFKTVAQMATSVETTVSIELPKLGAA